MQQNIAITYTKATGIILMVLAHCSHFPLLYQIVYSFHMPLFFIVSGYCFKAKYFNEPVSFVWKRIKGLWWPYVKWGFVFILLHNVFIRLNIYDGIEKTQWYSVGDYQNRFVALFLHMSMNEELLAGFWFIRALFFGSLLGYLALLLCHLISKLLGCKMMYTSIVGGALMFFACLMLNYVHNTLTILYIDPTCFLAATFFIIGYVFADISVPRFNMWQGILIFTLMVTNSFYNLITISNLYFEMGKLIPYSVTAVLGTWCIYSLPWQKLKGLPSKLMEYIGNHTLVILTWHFLCFKIVSIMIICIYGLSLERLADFPTIREFDNRGWFVVSTIIGVGLPLLIVYGYEKATAIIKPFNHA